MCAIEDFTRKGWRDVGAFAEVEAVERGLWVREEGEGEFAPVEVGPDGAQGETG